MSKGVGIAAIIAAGLAGIGGIVWWVTRRGAPVVTAEQLQAVYAERDADALAEYLEPLQRALELAGATQPVEAAAFLAQVGVESGELRWWVEEPSAAAGGPSFSRYENRRDLGNTEPGDGARYRGRGPIQLTGRANYRAAGEYLGLDLEANPDQVAEAETGLAVAAWYWQSRGLSELADAILTNDPVTAFRAVTFRINGGYNGEALREKLFARAVTAFGLPIEWPGAEQLITS